MAVDGRARSSRRAPTIGCSGWNYASWRGRFYPERLPPSRWFQHYASVFNTVEINNTFYRLPEASTFDRWREQSPRDFCFAVKASRFLTHMKRLREPKEPIRRLFSRVTHLNRHLGPVLYQLPGNFKCDLPRLEHFLNTLPRTADRRRGPLRHVVEFRHPSWYVAETYRLLERHGVALCAHDMTGSAIDTITIGPFVYVRFHGATGRYRGSYGDRTLRKWADRLAAEYRAGRDVYAYFNNDPDAVATKNALTLRSYVNRLM